MIVINESMMMLFMMIDMLYSIYVVVDVEWIIVVDIDRYVVVRHEWVVDDVFDMLLMIYIRYVVVRYDRSMLLLIEMNELFDWCIRDDTVDDRDEWIVDDDSVDVDRLMCCCSLWMSC